MEIYVMNHYGQDDQEGCFSVIKVYATKEEAKTAMETEIKAATEWLRQQYANQSDALRCVKYNIYDDCGDYGDGILCEQWEISKHNLNTTV